MPNSRGSCHKGSGLPNDGTIWANLTCYRGHVQRNALIEGCPVHPGGTGTGSLEEAELEKKAREEGLLR